MQKRLLFDGQLLKVTIGRLCRQLIEVHNDFSDTVIIGLQPRGIFLAERIKDELVRMHPQGVLLGYLDATFHRDDLKR